MRSIEAFEKKLEQAYDYEKDSILEMEIKKIEEESNQPETQQPCLPIQQIWELTSKIIRGIERGERRGEDLRSLFKSARVLYNTLTSAHEQLSRIQLKCDQKKTETEIDRIRVTFREESNISAVDQSISRLLKNLASLLQRQPKIRFSLFEKFVIWCRKVKILAGKKKKGAFLTEEEKSLIENISLATALCCCLIILGGIFRLFLLFFNPLLSLCLTCLTYLICDSYALTVSLRVQD